MQSISFKIQDRIVQSITKMFQNEKKDEFSFLDDMDQEPDEKNKANQEENNNLLRLYENEFSDFLILQETQGFQIPKQITLQEWKIIAKQGFGQFSRSDISNSLLCGIPFEIRQAIWLLMAKVQEQIKEHKNKGYNILKQKSDRYQDQIQKDLDRTLPDNEYFKGNRFNSKSQSKARLRNILNAYANFDQEVGYVQGMNFIAGALLILMNPENDQEYSDWYIVDDQYEESVFWIFTFIMIDSHWRLLFLEDFPGLIPLLKELEDQMRRNVPRVLEHIVKMEVQMVTIFQHHFFTLLIYKTPMGFAQRVLDLFLFEGKDAMLSLLIKILKNCEEKILQCTEMDVLIGYFKNDMIKDCHEKFKESLQMGAQTGENCLTFSKSEIIKL